MKLKNILNWILITVAVMILPACGGGGSTEDNNSPESETIVLIPNEASAKINANNPVDINSSVVVSKDLQTMVLSKDIPFSIDRPLFLDGIYQGIIASVVTNTDNTVTVTFRDADDLSEILDTLSIEVDTSEGVVSPNASGSSTQKLSSNNISLYDNQNTKQISYSLLSRSAKSTEGKTEPVLRIDIPADYKIPVLERNAKVTCDLFDTSCTGTFDGGESSNIDLGDSTTQNGITFSTEGSYVEIGLGMYLKLFADINSVSNDILRFTLKESAYFESQLKASVSGSLSTEWEKVIPLTKVITVSIPVYGKIVTANVGLQPYIIIGANGKITGEVVLSSYTLRKGDITFAFDSEIDGENKLQTTESIEFNPTDIDEDGVNVHIDANGEAFSTAGIQMTPSVSLANILDIDIGDIRGGVKASANIEGEIDTGFEVINDDASANLDAMAQLWVETYPKIDYKLNIGIDPIGLDPISFYSQSDYSLLYQGPVITVFDWQVSLLNDPQVKQSTSGDETHVTFDIEADSSIKPFVKFYYTTDETDPVESSENLWDESAIVITEETTIQVKAVVHVSDYSDSLWSFGKSVSRTVTELIDTIDNISSVYVNAGSDISILAGYPITITGTVDSNYNDIVSFEWSECGTVLSTSDTFTKSFLTLGEHTLAFTTTDKEGNTLSYNVTIRVNSCTGHWENEVCVESWDSGILSQRVPYVDGLIHGIVLGYDQFGNPEWTMTCENGVGITSTDPFGGGEIESCAWTEEQFENVCEN